MAVVDTATAVAARPPARSFVSPTVDFLCLGGGSLILTPVLMYLVPDTANASVLLFAVFLSFVVNHPHFMHSYQIFYRTYRRVTQDRAIDPQLRRRYVWAGVGAPALMVLFFAAAFAWSDPRILGYAGSAMVFFVGWHYAKQGYGMLMVDAALKRSFFSEREKKVILVNSYLCWMFSWLSFSQAVEKAEFWGVKYATIVIPVPLIWISGIALAASTLITAVVLVRHGRANRGTVPINGIAAYVAALYPWLLLGREPVLGALIPAMHSLQYLLIVWRYQLNVESAQPDAGQRPNVAGIALPDNRIRRFAGFITRGIVWGLVGFWILPYIFSTLMPYDRAEYGDRLFFFVIIIFINIHHYFIDNAMWRRENPETLRYLFAHR